MCGRSNVSHFFPNIFPQQQQHYYSFRSLPMSISPRFTQNYRDTTLSGATRSAQVEQARYEKLQIAKQRSREVEEQRIAELRKKHSFDPETRKKWNQEHSDKDQGAKSQQNIAATRLQAQWRGSNERTASRYNNIVQSIKNEESVRQRQTKAAELDLSRHRAAAVSAASFHKRGVGPTTTMQRTTGRDGASPQRPSRPGAQQRRFVAAPSARLTRPGRRVVPKRRKTGVPTPRRVKLSTEQKKRATRASKRGAATQWALQRKKAAQHALFVKIRREMTDAGHDPKAVTNNALIVAKKIIIKREREQLEREAEKLRLLEEAEKRMVRMQQRTKQAAAKKWEERQAREAPVAVSSLWRPSSGGGYGDGGGGGDGGDEGEDASFLLGPVPKQKLPVRKSFKASKSPERVWSDLKNYAKERQSRERGQRGSQSRSRSRQRGQRPSTGVYGTRSRRDYTSMPKRPSTSGDPRRGRQQRRSGGGSSGIGGDDDGGDDGGGGGGDQNSERDFPSRPETTSAMYDVGVVSDEDEMVEKRSGMVGRQSGEESSVASSKSVEKNNEEEEEEEDDYGEDDYEDEDGFEDDEEENVQQNVQDTSMHNINKGQKKE